MKKNLSLILICFLAAFTQPVLAQVKFGVKAGVNLAEVSFNKDFGNNFRSSNRTGFIVGPTIEAMVPFIGLGLDGSLLYSQKGINIDNGQKHINGSFSYLEVPVNLKWKFGIPKVIGIYLAAGPYASVALGNSLKEFKDNLHLDNFDWGINAGAGVELFGHLQVGANYSYGFTKSKFTFFDESYGFHNRMWTISAAYYF
ncbi:MAG: porin family protein [Bacteroidales bacterium]